jgi:hypothetical protein
MLDVPVFEECRFSHIYHFSVNIQLAFMLGARAMLDVPIYEESIFSHIYHLV